MVYAGTQTTKNVLTGAWIVLFAVLISGVASAKEQDAKSNEARPSVASIAARVLTALNDEDKSTLSVLANADEPDPWLVAHELCKRETHLAANAFANATAASTRSSLVKYVEVQTKTGVHAATEKALASARAAFNKKDLKGLLKSLASIDDAPVSVARIEAQYLRGIALQTSGSVKESIEAFRAVRQSAASLGWLAREADALYELGRSALATKKTELALASWKQQLAIDTQRGNKTSLARCHSALSNAYSRTNNPETAVEHGSKALELFRATKNNHRTAEIAHRLASLYERLNESDKAISHFKESAALFSKAKNKPFLAPTLHNLGRVHDHRGEHPEALKYYAESLVIFRELGNKKNVAHALSSIATMHEKLGSFNKAIKTAEESLAICQSINDSHGIARALNDLGIICEGAGRLADAIKHYSAAREIFRALKDEGRVAQETHNLGVVYDRRGDVKRAMACFREAMAVFDDQGDLRGGASCRNNLALALIHSGRVQEGIAYQEECLRIHRTLKNKDGAARALSNIGMTHAILGDTKKAIEMYKESVAIRRTIADVRGLTESLHNLASAYEELSQADRAMNLYKEALALKKRIGDPASIAATLVNMGILFGRRGETAKAIQHFKEGYASFKSIHDQAGMASALSNLGKEHVRLGEATKALAVLKEAQSYLQDSPAWHTKANVLGSLASLAMRSKDYVSAVALAREGSDVVLRVSAQLADVDAARANELYSDVYELGVWAAHKAGDATSLFSMLEHGRASSLRLSLGSRKQLEAAVIPETLRQELAEAREQERVALDALAGARASTDIAVRKARKRAWLRAQDQVRTVTARIERDAKSAAHVTLSQPDTMAQAQARLEEDEAMVLYQDTEHGSLALIIRRDQARAVDLPSFDYVRKTVRTLLDSGKGINPAAASSLATLVVDPLKLSSDVRRVLISPTDVLGFIPFSLVMPDNVVSYTPSATTHGILYQHRDLRGKRVLAVGDPDYDAIVGEDTKTVTGALPEETLSGKQVLAARRGSGFFKLARLPNTRIEVSAIGSVKLLGKEATETGFAKAVQQEARWRSVHFACHGLVSPSRPTSSALALAADTESDGLLTALEVFRMKVPTDLVVMSACRTGKGKIYKTEGIVGLTRAFMFAGTPRVLCSLWDVDDEATKALMIKFYEYWSPKDGKGLTAAEALKRAQDHVRAQKKWEHPAYWAAWVLWGLP